MTGGDNDNDNDNDQTTESSERRFQSLVRKIL